MGSNGGHSLNQATRRSWPPDRRSQRRRRARAALVAWVGGACGRLGDGTPRGLTSWLAWIWWRHCTRRSGGLGPWAACSLTILCGNDRLEGSLPGPHLFLGPWVRTTGHPPPSLTLVPPPTLGPRRLQPCSGAQHSRPMWGCSCPTFRRPHWPWGSDPSARRVYTVRPPWPPGGGLRSNPDAWGVAGGAGPGVGELVAACPGAAVHTGPGDGPAPSAPGRGW